MALPERARKTWVCITEGIAAEILDRLSEGQTLTSICASDPERYPTPGAIVHRARKDPEGFGVEYAYARELGADVRGDRYLDKGDALMALTNPTMPDCQKVRVSAEIDLRYLERRHPERWGPRGELMHLHTHGGIQIMIPDNGRGGPDPYLLDHEPVGEDGGA